MEKKHKILIVEDGAFNRSLLRKILQDTYEIVEADNGQAAFDYLETEYKNISAIILDLVMPIMDGFTFMKIAQKDKRIKNIPILVTTVLDESTSELEALKLGASDFIAKPFNPVVIKQRLFNVISLYENFVLKNELEKDELTNLYNSDMFADACSSLIENDKDNSYAIIVINFKDFKFVNNIIGYESGDSLLVYLADIIRRESNIDRCVYGRLSSDKFVVCMPNNIEFVLNFIKLIKLDIENFTKKVNINLHFGIYLTNNEDHNTNVKYMIDLATIASKNHNSQEFYTVYSPELGKEMALKEELQQRKQIALDNHEFTIFFQPKYNLAKEIVGLEALSRWNHPTHGIIEPSQFVAMLDEARLIRHLDLFVLDYVCALLSHRIKNGNKVLPVTLNIARSDMYDSHLFNNVLLTLNKYQIPHHLIHFEFSEELYHSDYEMFVRTVERAIKLGINVDISDFGKTYGSINLLVNFPIHSISINLRTVNASEETLSRIVEIVSHTNCKIQLFGIESDEDLAFANSLPVDAIQGRYLHQPVPFEELENF